MAMAVGVIANRHALEMSQMTQQQIESAASELELLCLVVLTDSIRQDSKDTISELQERLVFKHHPGFCQEQSACCMLYLVLRACIDSTLHAVVA